MQLRDGNLDEIADASASKYVCTFKTVHKFPCAFVRKISG
jgi:hypothetical protein